jgi:hexosaminidase
MIRLSLILFVVATLFACTEQKKELNKEIDIIPQPNSIEYASGNFIINEETAIVFDKKFDNTNYLQDFLQETFDKDFDILEDEREDNVFLFVYSDTMVQDAYILDISEEQIRITASSSSACFYALQTMRQITNKKEETTEVLCTKIADAPRFEYRGMHLDVCRHFFDVAFVKRYIDILAMHKMNYMHWHLTEDQGWRIEIEGYENLTTIGSQRKETVIGKNWGEYDGISYGGYYTQEEVKEIVAYAESRFITIVPEIEMPGHSLAALASYPELGCTGGPYEVACTWGVFDDVYCAGNEETFAFLEEVIDQVCELFPGPYIHIGGDECPKTKWEKCPKCQKRMQEEGLKDEHELQSYFISRMEKYINAKGKTIIGWDEILEGGLAENAIVMSWRGEEGGIEAAKMQHQVIMTPGDYCYFDHYQVENTEKEPLAIGGLTTVQDVYMYNPIPKELTEEEAIFILGAQANMWTEYILDEDHLEYMILPRMTALSEVLWSKEEDKDWDDFLLRLDHFKRLYDEMQLNYAKHLFEK